MVACSPNLYKPSILFRPTGTKHLYLNLVVNITKSVDNDNQIFMRLKGLFRLCMTSIPERDKYVIFDVRLPAR